MNPDQANALAVRYKNIWRGGPSPDELRAQFTDMDHTRADNLLTTLARDLEHPPTVHTLWERYRAALNAERRPPPGPEFTGPPASRADAIARLEWRVSTGSATAADIEALEGLYAVARHHEPEPVQLALEEADQ